MGSSQRHEGQSGSAENYGIALLQLFSTVALLNFNNADFFYVLKSDTASGHTY